MTLPVVRLPCAAVRGGGGGYNREVCCGPFALCGRRKGTATRRRAPIPLWDILPRERDKDCGHCLFPRTAQSKTLAVALNCMPKQFNTTELLVERHAFDSHLRALDALQLAVALEVRNQQLVDHFVAADGILCEVAGLEGFSVVNPERS